MPEEQARAQTKALTEVLEDVSTDFIRTDRFERFETRMVTEFEKVRLEFRAELSEKLRNQSLAVIGANAALLAAAVALLKLTP